MNISLKYSYFKIYQNAKYVLKTFLSTTFQMIKVYRFFPIQNIPIILNFTV